MQVHCIEAPTHGMARTRCRALLRCLTARTASLLMAPPAAPLWPLAVRAIVSSSLRRSTVASFCTALVTQPPPVNACNHNVTKTEQHAGYRCRAHTTCSRRLTMVCLSWKRRSASSSFGMVAIDWICARRCPSEPCQSCALPVVGLADTGRGAACRWAMGLRACESGTGLVSIRNSQSAGSAPSLQLVGDAADVAGRFSCEPLASKLPRSRDSGACFTAMGRMERLSTTSSMLCRCTRALLPHARLESDRSSNLLSTCIIRFSNKVRSLEDWRAV